MKKFISKVSIILILFLIVGCSNGNNEVKENNATAENNAVENNIENKSEVSEKEKYEDLTPEVKKDNNKNLKVIAGTKEVVDFLEKLGYENVVATPEDYKGSFNDAVSIGKAETPDIDVINSFFGDWGEGIIFITDNSVKYSDEFIYNLKLPYLVLNAEDENDKGNLLTLGSVLGLDETASKIVENL